MNERVLISVETFRTTRELSRSRAYEVVRTMLAPAGAVVRFGRTIRLDLARVRELELGGGFPLEPRRRRGS